MYNSVPAQYPCLYILPQAICLFPMHLFHIWTFFCHEFMASIIELSLSL